MKINMHACVNILVREIPVVENNQTIRLSDIVLKTSWFKFDLLLSPTSPRGISKIVSPSCFLMRWKSPKPKESMFGKFGLEGLVHEDDICTCLYCCRS